MHASSRPFLIALFSLFTPWLAFAQYGPNRTVVADLFSTKVEIVKSPVELLTNPAIQYWQLIGGGTMEEKEFQNLKGEIVSGMYFGKDGLFIIGCNDTARRGNPNMLSGLFGCSNALGQFEIDENNALTYYGIYGEVKNEKIIKLDNNRLITEDENKFRYYYVSRTNPTHIPEEIAIKQYETLEQVGQEFTNPKTKYQNKKLGIAIEDMATDETKALSEEDEVYTYVDSMPEFPGGETEMIKFVRNNIAYPEASSRNSVEGLVILTFIVKQDGTLDEVQVLKSLDKHTDQEAIRLVSTMPRWKPGVKNGKEVNCKYTLPLRFKLP